MVRESEGLIKKQFSFPPDFDMKLKLLMHEHGCKTETELIQLAIRRLEEAIPSELDGCPVDC